MRQADAATPPAPRALPEGARVLILRFSSLGDVVKCTALPRLIKARYPGARLTMVTAQEFVELIGDNPHLEQAVGFDRRAGPGALLALVRRLRAERFDLVVDVHRSLRSRIVTALLGAPRTSYGKRTLQRFLLIHFRWNSYREAKGKEEDFLAGLIPYGVRDDGRGTELHVGGAEIRRRLRERLKPELDRIARWRKAGRPVLGVAAIAAWDLKRWPMSHFRALLEGFVRRTGGGLIVFGGPGDEQAQALLEGRERDGVSLVGRTSHLESAYFASLADLVVSNDTGMAHLAEAVGTDVIALYGPTSRELGYYPVREGSLALEAPLPCRPCTRTGKGRCTHPFAKACLWMITPEQVLAAVLKKLRRGGRRSRS
jgi:heptosyltransferase-2